MVPNGIAYIKPLAIRQWAVERGYETDLEFMQELKAYIRALDQVWVPIKFKELKLRKK